MRSTFLLLFLICLKINGQSFNSFRIVADEMLQLDDVSNLSDLCSFKIFGNDKKLGKFLIEEITSQNKKDNYKIIHKGSGYYHFIKNRLVYKNREPSKNFQELYVYNRNGKDSIYYLKNSTFQNQIKEYKFYKYKEGMLSNFRESLIINDSLNIIYEHKISKINNNSIIDEKFVKNKSKNLPEKFNHLLKPTKFKTTYGENNSYVLYRYTNNSFEPYEEVKYNSKGKLVYKNEYLKMSAKYFYNEKDYLVKKIVLIPSSKYDKEVYMYSYDSYGNRDELTIQYYIYQKELIGRLKAVMSYKYQNNKPEWVNAEFTNTYMAIENGIETEPNTFMKLNNTYEIEVKYCK